MSVTTDNPVEYIDKQMVEPKGRSLAQDAWIRFRRNKAAMVSLVVLFLIVAFSILVPIIGPYDYAYTDWDNMLIGPSWETKHYFGTDALGRDMMVRVALGGRISMMVGVIGAFVAVFIGTVYGTASAYLGGKYDMIMQRFIEIIQALPFMFMVIILVTIFDRSLILLFVALGLTSWTGMARLVRGQTLGLMHKEFIEAAHVGGVRSNKIISRHLVPNVLGIVAIDASMAVPGMIMTEAFLSYLGLGVQEPETSWGVLLNEGATTMEIAPWQLIIPAAMMAVTLFCFNFIGDGLRDALDPKDR